MVEIEKAHESLELLGLNVGSALLEAKLEDAAKRELTYLTFL